jgi:hypothetical protein
MSKLLKSFKKVTKNGKEIETIANLTGIEQTDLKIFNLGAEGILTDSQKVKLAEVIEWTRKRKVNFFGFNTLKKF